MKCRWECAEDGSILRAWDSNGTEIKPGDILMSVDYAEPLYHAVFNDIDWTGNTRNIGFEIRDLNNNNSWMWDWCNTVIVGPYWRHLDKLDDEDLDHYWQTTREEAVLKASNEEEPTND